MACREPVAGGATNVLKLLHELQAQQTELEMQNESLRAAQARIEDGQHFTDLYEFSPVSYFSVERDSSIGLLNLAGSSLLGMERSQLASQRLADYVAPDSLPTFNAFLARVFAKGGRDVCEIEVRPVGNSPPVMVSVDGVTDERGRVCNLALTNITKHKALVDALHEQKEFFRSIAESIDGFIAVLDTKGRRVYTSPSYMRLLGERGISGTVSFADVHPADRECIEQAFRQTVATGVGQHLEYRFMMADGDIRILESQGGVVRDAEGRIKYVVVVSHDITERKKAAEKIHHLAFYDTLTKLPNRLTLSDRLQQVMTASKRSGRYGAVLFLDLDHFKPLNDTHGHEAGDLLLIKVADRIANCVREMDTVARFGGDEFAVMLGELDVDLSVSAAQAGLVAEKIRCAIAEPFLLDVKECDGSSSCIEHHCTASIGVALFLNHEYSEEEVIKAADVAMYQAKRGGRNRIFFHEEKR